MKEYNLKIGTAFLLVLAYLGIALYQDKFYIVLHDNTWRI